MGSAGLQVDQNAKSTAASAFSSRRIASLVGQMAPGAQLSARMPSAAQATDKAARSVLAPLALYAHFDTGISDPVALAKLVARLQTDPAVATTRGLTTKPLLDPTSLRIWPT